MKSYQEEVQELHHHRVYYILLGGIIFMVLFSCLDFIMVRELFWEFFFCRLGGAAIGMVFVYLNYRDKAKNYAFITGFTGFVAISLVMLVMIYRMGGVISPYYVGLLVTMTIYAAFAPITTCQTLISGLLLATLYTATVILTPSTNETVTLELFANLFFIISMVCIIATQSWADTRARRREYQLRIEENRIAEQLSRQAEILEREVKKRSREQAESEARYRLLFNQIADDIALISPEGTLLQANTNFNNHYISEGSGATMPLATILPKSEQAAVDELLTTMVNSGNTVRNHPMRLIQRDGTHAETEVSASLLQRDHSVYGILLLIRDISARKEMEQKLFASFELRKQTETSAILALAKLSEFRDTTSSNHLERIREYCRILGMELAQYPELKGVMTPTYIEDIYHASILHDIGKVALPERFDEQENSTPEKENEQIRRHTIAGGDVIREMQEESKGSSFLEMAKHIAYFHHERWDGKGSPFGLMKREIPLAARIVALADTYEEITTASSDMPDATIHEKAMEHLALQSGLQFDPLVVGAFMTRQEEFKAVLQKFMTS